MDENTHTSRGSDHELYHEKRKKIHGSWGKCLRAGSRTLVEGKRDSLSLFHLSRIDGRISPRTGASRRKPWPIARARDRIALGGGMMFLLVLEDGSWVRLGCISDNVGHIPVWGAVRSLFPCGGKRA
jgi:hypothetical protein